MIQAFRWLRSRGPRFYLMVAACLALALTALRPSAQLPRETYGLVFILDITQSMNTADVHLGGAPATRLAAAKAAVRDSLARLPCGSEAGLGVFTEYRSFLLLAPVEVCSGYAELLATLERMDWRMGWAGASQVGKGLHFGLQLARALELRPALVFMSDGHEAPPVNPVTRYPVENPAPRVPGLIVGVGGDALSPIPKFDMEGNDLGFWDEQEVTQLSVPARGGNADAQTQADAAQRVKRGAEHLSSLKEPHLKELAAEAGLRYVRLGSPDTLLPALRRPDLARSRPVATDLRWTLAGAALLALAVAFAPIPLARKSMSRG
ncbi:MAG TPA: vWA domain-containing protein [Burkholderiales bacterium]|nr:vWA domain-containing protein [Burkholderiales bacterium]